jgi:sulfur relay protein TusB/DsrH
MSVLHQILSSGPDALGDCISVISEGDSIILVGVGVTLVSTPDVIFNSPESFNSGIELFVSESDASAQGMLEQAHQLNMKVLDDDQWVGLLNTHQHVLSWK